MNALAPAMPVYCPAGLVHLFVYYKSGSFPRFGPGLLLGTDAPIMTPNGIDLSLFSTVY